MTDSRRVLLLVDHKFRDLPGMALLKVLLESRYGHRVMLAPSENQDFLDDAFDPDLVVVPYLWGPANVARARALRDRGVGVAVILTEGHSILDYLMEQIAGCFTDLSVADVYFVWNETVRNLMVRYRTLPEERIVLGGVPRFDFYREPWRRLQPTRADFCRRYGIDASGPIVTWATNFGFVRLAGNDDMIAATQRKYEAEGVAKFPLLADIGKLAHAEVTTREILGNAVVQLALKFPEATFVVKPHPAEEPGWYFHLRDGAGLKNIVILQRAVIWDVLPATDVHLHRSCTTAAEAWLLGRPTIDLQLDSNVTWFSPDMALAGDVAHDFDALVAHVSHYLADPRVRPEHVEPRARIIRDWYGDVDGHRTELHAAVLDTFLRSRPSRRRRRGGSRLVEATVRVRWAVGLEHYDPLRRVFQSPAQRGRVDERSGRDKFVRTSEVQAWTERIERMLASGAS